MDLPIFYDEVEEWNRTLLVYEAALKEVSTKIEILNSEFKLAHRYNPIEHVTSRIKTPQSIAKKMRHNQRELTVENIVKYINDVAGIRIICSFTSDIYRIAALICKQNDVKVLKVKDYIMKPKENGYTSYHMIISVPIFLSDTMIETKVEIQIRTIAMDFWASLEHKMYYKFEGNAPEHIRRELRECADIVGFLDKKMLALNEEIKKFSDDRINTYKEKMSDMFQNSIRESYGTVIDEESEVITIDGCKMEEDSDIYKNDVALYVMDTQADDMLSAMQQKIMKESKEKIVEVSENEVEKKEEKKTKASSKESNKIPFTASIFGRNKQKKQEVKAKAVT